MIEKEFAEKYPSLFVNLTNERSPMKYGIGIHEGWYPLLDELCAELTALNKPNLKFSQIKEKFGILRCYLDGSDKEVYYITDKYEQKAAKICEYCGNPGELDIEHVWIKTLCSNCQATR